MGKQDEIKVISVYVAEAIESGLESELMYIALKAMQEDSNLTPSLAVQGAFEELVP